MSEVVKFPNRVRPVLGPMDADTTASGTCPFVAEWDVKMRLVGPTRFEFELPEMSMTANCVEDMVAAFRAAVEKAVIR